MGRSLPKTRSRRSVVGGKLVLDDPQREDWQHTKKTMIVFNAISQLASFGGILLLQTFYMILVARVLGPEDFGRFSFAWSIIHIMLIGGSLGLGNTALRKISADPGRSVEISQTFFCLRIILAVAQFALLLALAYVIRETPETRGMLAVFGLGMLFHSICFSMNIVFQAHGKLYLASINAFVVFGGHAVIGLVILYFGGHLVALSTAYLGASIVGLVMNLRVFSKRIHGFRAKQLGDWREFVRQSIPVGLGNFFSTVSGRIAITLLIFLAGPLATGIFSAASRIPMVLRNVPSALLAAIIPVMAANQERSDAVHRLFKKSFTLMMLMALPLSLGFFTFARSIILLLFGPQYLDSVESLQILSWVIIPMFAGMTFEQVILSQDHLVRRVPWVAGAALGIGAVVCILLIPRLGGEGAAYGVLIAQIVRASGSFLAARGFLFSHRET